MKKEVRKVRIALASPGKIRSRSYGAEEKPEAIHHRALKPDNVLVGSRTLRPYVVDFGICPVLERRGTAYVAGSR